MIRYTTPAQTIIIKGVNLTGKTVKVVYKSEYLGEVVIATNATVSYKSDTDTTTIVCTLTQEQTAKLHAGKCYVQVNWVASGSRYATKIQEFILGENLLEAVI